MNEQQKKQMAQEIELAVAKLINVSLFINRFGRTKKFYVCSDELVKEAHQYMQSKGYIKQTETK